MSNTYDKEAKKFIDDSKKLKLIMKLMYITHEKDTKTMTLEPPLKAGMGKCDVVKVAYVKKSKNNAEQLF